jgi:glutamyl-Q tRNA(Asp) synthetase
MYGNYRGRFAPSPTGPLHAGSLVAALASWLDARAHDGRWLVRIEDLDPPREVAGSARGILDTLAALGMDADEPVVHQSDRGAAYAAALARLDAAGLLFACTCSRRLIEEQTTSPGRAPGIYPGTCRGRPLRPGAAVRIRVPGGPAAAIAFDDRRCGRVAQRLDVDVGDFVLRRADGIWAYQLAVVVDDAAAGISDVVRGADLLDNTPRQIFLQRALGLASPRMMHVPLVTDRSGRKLSKQSGAAAIDPADGLAALERAWRHLGGAAIGADTRAAFIRRAIELWRGRWAA